MSSGYDWLDVESLDLEAQGVAHRADGKVVFIEGALPGERVQVQVARKKNQWEQGQMSALARESAQRVRPGCPHFGLHAGACGGCKMQHLDAAAQVAGKEGSLEGKLRHLGEGRPGNLIRPREGPPGPYPVPARRSGRPAGWKGGALIRVPQR